MPGDTGASGSGLRLTQVFGSCFRGSGSAATARHGTAPRRRNREVRMGILLDRRGRGGRKWWGPQMNGVCPGIATAGVAIGPHSYRGGVRSSFELRAISQVIVLPVYVAMRPRIASSVL